MRLLLSVLGAALVGAVAVSAAPAAGPDAATFALIPQHYDPTLRATRSYFVAVAKPGTTFRNSVRVRNLGTKTGTAYVYAVDATTGQTSGLQPVWWFEHAVPRDRPRRLQGHRVPSRSPGSSSTARTTAKSPGRCRRSPGVDRAEARAPARGRPRPSS